MQIDIITTIFSVEIGLEDINIGLLTAFLKNKYDVRSHYYYKPDDETIEVRTNSDLYIFSIFYNNIEFCNKIIREIRIKNPSSLIIWCGNYATLYSKELLAYDTDYILLGDEEIVIDNIINLIENNESDNIKYLESVLSKHCKENKKIAHVDITKLPNANRDCIRKRKYLSAIIQDSQGCTSNCSFCIQNVSSPKWIGRELTSIRDEIISIYNSLGIRHFIFIGSSIEDPGLHGKERIKEFCSLILDTGVSFSFRYYQRADSMKNIESDVELLQLMNKCGFNTAMVGIESGNDDDLILYNKRANLVDNYATLDLLRSQEINVDLFGFLMFNPYTDFEKLKKNYYFLSKQQTPYVKKYISRVGIYNGTKLFTQARSDGLITDKYDFKRRSLKYTYLDNDVNSFMSSLNENIDFQYFEKQQTLIEGCIDIISGFYRFVPDGYQYYMEMENLFKTNAFALSNFFHHLYVKSNLQYCIDAYCDFLKEQQNNDDKLRILLQKFMKKLYIHKIQK